MQCIPSAVGDGDGDGTGDGTGDGDGMIPSDCEAEPGPCQSLCAQGLECGVQDDALQNACATWATSTDACGDFVEAHFSCMAALRCGGDTFETFAECLDTASELGRCMMASSCTGDPTNCVELCDNANACSAPEAFSNMLGRCYMSTMELGCTDPAMTHFMCVAPDTCVYEGGGMSACDPMLPPPCEWLTCGDGFVEGFEECDDGNLVDGDGCRSDCLME
jgi:cysteine-rich repeat protein